MEFWLFIYITFAGKEPVILVDKTVDSLEICFQEAKSAIEKSMVVVNDEKFEFAATCSVIKPDETPL